MLSKLILVRTKCSRFISGHYLPSSVLDTAPLRQLWASALEHIFVVNDILSGYKEILAGDVSLLTLLVSHHGSLQESVDTAVRAVNAATDDIEDAALILKSSVEDQETLDRYIEAVRACCVGNIMWSLGTKRYKLAPLKKLDGTIEMTFDMLEGYEPGLYLNNGGEMLSVGTP